MNKRNESSSIVNTIVNNLFFCMRHCIVLWTIVDHLKWHIEKKLYEPTLECIFPEKTAHSCKDAKNSRIPVIEFDGTVVKLK